MDAGAGERSAVVVDEGEEWRDRRWDEAPAPVQERGDVAFRRALAGRRRVAFALTAAAWVGTCAWFWTWWLRGSHRGDEAAFAVNSLLLAFEFAVLPGYFLFFAGRARRIAPGRLPAARVAMVVTRAPSEPWAVARRTLLGALAQDVEVPYDVWLADEDPGPEVARWCEAHGVELISRRGVPGYHRPTWPRRARCKEGNLAHFYDRVGYDAYDIVSQLDVDHAPAPGYLAAMLRPFADARVGWVAAPSVCDTNASSSWAARGRLHVEAAMHGAVQAGGNGGWAPCAIGSHYAVRTAALRAVGGLGPELAEDFSTTLRLASAGWEGAFAIDAEAHGQGPATLGDAATQELQWARSMMTIMLTAAGGALARARPRARAKLAFCLAWYPLDAGVLLGLHVLPVAALLTGVAPARVGLGAFWLHLLPSAFLLLGAVGILRGAALLRPADAPVLSWEAVLFIFIRWPWVLLGCVAAVVGRVRGHCPEWKITPKGGVRGRRLEASVLAPPLVVSVVSATAVLLAHDPGDARGYRFWATANALVYLGVALAIVLLHRRDTRHGSLAAPAAALLRPRTLALAAGRVATFAAAAVLLAAAVGQRRDSFADAPPARAASAVLDLRGLSWPAPPPGRRVGVTTAGTAASTVRRWPDDVGRDIAAFAAIVHRRLGVVSLFADWAHGPPALAQLEAIRRAGAEPEITWEPWDADLPAYRRQPRYSLRSIAAGEHDALQRRFAAVLRAYGGPVRVRFAHEMNAPAYPWSALRVRDGWKWYIAAWRHVHDVVEGAGARNVQWVWAPVAGRPASGFYPGDRYVDVLGLSGFNGGDELQWSGWRSFAAIFEDSLEMLEKRAAGKPLEISEVAVARVGGSRAAWVRDMWRTLRRHPRVTSVTWFDVPKETDWRLGLGSDAARAFGRGARSWLGGAPVPGDGHAPLLVDNASMSLLPGA